MSIINNSQVVDRTGAITRIPFQPNLLRALGLFGEQNVSGESITFDERDSRLLVLDDHLRNVDKTNGIDPSKYTPHLLPIPHYPQESTITVRSLCGIRNFDSDIEQAVENAVSEHLEKHANNHDNHLEYLEAMMICSGKIITNNFGTFDMFSEFGITKQADEIDFDDKTPLEPQFRAITNKMKKAYQGGRSRGYVVLCGSTFFDNFVTHSDIKEGFVIAGQSSPLRNELGEVANGYTSFQYGNITFIQYDDQFTQKDGTNIQPLGDSAAVMFPRGMLGSVFFGSKSTLAGCGMAGAKRFASTYRDPKDRYVEVESEQNTLVVMQEVGSVHYLSIKTP